MGIRSLLAASVLALPALATAGVDEVAWHESLDEARVVAARERRPLLVYFWLDGSSFCQKLFAETLTTEAGAAELAHYVCVSAPADRADVSELVTRFGVTTLPTLVFLDQAANAEDAIDGFIDLPGFLQESRRIRRGERTVSDWRRRAAAAPDDLDLRLRLALALEHVGQADECERLTASIKADDPDGRTVAAAQLFLYDVFEEVRSSASDRSDSSTYDLTPLYAHLPKVKPEAVLYEGWRWIIDVEKQHGERGKERVALANTWKYAPQGAKRLQAASALLVRYFETEVELTAKERRLTKRVADEIAQVAEARTGMVTDGNEHVALALALTINGKLDEACSELRKALQAAPENASHRALLDELTARRR